MLNADSNFQAGAAKPFTPGETIWLKELQEQQIVPRDLCFAQISSILTFPCGIKKRSVSGIIDGIERVKYPLSWQRNAF